MFKRIKETILSFKFRTKAMLVGQVISTYVYIVFLIGMNAPEMMPTIGAVTAITN